MRMKRRKHIRMGREMCWIDVNTLFLKETYKIEKKREIIPIYLIIFYRFFLAFLYLESHVVARIKYKREKGKIKI